MNKWHIRDPKDSDISFIYATWLNSYHYDSWTKTIQKSIFFDNYKLVIDEILINAKIKIACLQNDYDIILGYLVYDEPNIIHYCFVKNDFRQFGVANSLMVESKKHQGLLTITHRTKSVADLLRAKNNFTFNPFKLYKGV